MPEIRVGSHRIAAQEGDNLLDTLLAAGMTVPWSCRSGHCQTCLVQARSEQVPYEAAAHLAPEQQENGWLLSCQCPIHQDMDIHLHDPTKDSLSAEITASELLADDVLRLRLRPHGPLRYKPGQHLVLWTTQHLGRPYSIANLPSDEVLELHIALHAHGASSAAVRKLALGDIVHLGTPAGHLHYDPEWQDRPLLLLAKGTGLAPLQAIAREALERGHTSQIELWHWSNGGKCYLSDALEAWAAQHPQVALHWRHSANIDSDLRQLRLASRSTMALVCGSPAFTEQVRKPLFMAGLPGRQIIDEAFLQRKQ